MKNAKIQQYQEIEADSHLSTQQSKVVALHPTAQPDATEMQHDTTETQQGITYPISLTDLAKHKSKDKQISRQALARKFNAIAEVYADFPLAEKVEIGGKATKHGHDQIEDLEASPLSLKSFCEELREKLQKEAIAKSPAGSLALSSPVSALAEIVSIEENDFTSTLANLSGAISAIQQKQAIPNIQAMLNLNASTMQTEQLLGTLAGTTRAAIRINAEESAYQQAMAENARLKQLLAEQSVKQVQGE